MVTHSRWLLIVVSLAAVAASAHAADKARESNSDKSSAAAAATPDNLPVAQQKLASEFKDLESVMMRMRDLIRPTDPNRAALIEKALKESGDRRVEADFQEIVDLLRQEQLGNAARRQVKINEDLDAILQLLLSEEYSKRIQERQAEYRKYLERLNNIIRDQSDVRGRTLSGDDLKQLSPEQRALADRTGGLSKDISKSQEKARGDAKGDGKGDKNNSKGDGKTQPGDGKSPDKSPGNDGSNSGKPDGKNAGKPDGKNSGKPDGKNSEKPDGKNSEKPDANGDRSKPGDQDAQGKGQSAQNKSQGKGQQSKGKPSKGQGQGQGQDQDPDQQAEDQSPQQGQDQSNQPQNQDPLRQRLQRAEEHMKQAEDQLKKAQKEGAADAQEKALEELRTAKAELEEILRQLREEQMKQLLASLIARMQKVLQVQREIYDGTVRLDKVPVAERSHGHEIESGRLSTRERSIIRDVEEALRLLREEGSAVAMPEALQQVHDDMEQIEQRLGQGKTEVLTQAIETDVIKELEEIVDAFKRAKERAENAKKPPSPSPNGAQPQDPPLIEKLAELKMIRALQMRVNRRTERYSKLIEPGREQANGDDVFEALQRLAEQQKRVQKVTRDIDLGKNE